MRRLGYTRYVAQGGDVGAAVTDAMGRQAPDGLLGIHLNLLLAGLGGGYPSGRPVRRGKRRARRDRHIPEHRQRLPHRAEHAAADDRLRPAGLPRRPGGLDARPRHRRLLQDLPRLCRRAALRRPHPGPRPRQHHHVLADRHRGLGGPVVLGEHPSRTRPAPGSRGRMSSSRSASPRSPARSSGPRAAGSRSPTPTSPTSTRSARVAISRPGKSPSCSRPRSGRRSGRCASASQHSPVARVVVRVQVFEAERPDRGHL